MATVKTNTDVLKRNVEGFEELTGKKKRRFSLVQANYTQLYDGDESFLAGPTERSLKIKNRR